MVSPDTLIIIGFCVRTLGDAVGHALEEIGKAKAQADSGEKLDGSKEVPTVPKV